MTVRILIVEDEAVNLALFRAVLSRHPELRQARLIEASSLEAARAAVAGGVFDVAVLDMRLPDGDGLTLARELRAQAQPPAILVVSANVQDERQREAEAIGVDGFIAKPYRPPVLVAAIERVLVGRGRE